MGTTQGCQGEVVISAGKWSGNASASRSIRAKEGLLHGLPQRPHSLVGREKDLEMSQSLPTPIGLHPGVHNPGHYRFTTTISTRRLRARFSSLVFGTLGLVFP